ncbi:YcaO-like family protein [Sorangium sp. So ce302]|uniref:YcaO-like family protein n=1 Tax=Sorangium sp. So ce302 TaxID=3133297 RepID=UPI003F5E750C
MMEPLELSQVLAFKPTLRVERMDPGVVFLTGERERFVLSGARMAEVAVLPDMRADIQECMRRLDKAGLELIVVDKTRPDIGLHVVQVIVSGLRQIWPRFGPGRLYEIPCALGWLDRPLAESELNPVPLFV